MHSNMASRSIQECHSIMQAPGAPWEMETKTINSRTVRVYKHLPPSLRAFWLSTKAFSSREYIIYESSRLTYSTAHHLVNHYALLFSSLSIKKGDRVALLMRNLPEFILSFWAISMLGGIVVAINAWGTKEQVMHCLESSGSRLVIVDGERMKLLEGKREKESLKGFGCENVLVVRPEGKVSEGFVELEEALKGVDEKGELPEVEVGPEDLACIFFTSGTTSLPKGVISTQRAFLTNRLNTSVATARNLLRRGLDLPKPDPKAPQKALLLSVPLFHVIGSHSFMQLMTALGGKIVMLHKYSLPQATSLILSENITLAGGVPHMVMELVEQLSGSKHKLEGLSFGGGPASVRLPETVEKFLGGNVPAGQGYGLTETNSVATSFTGLDYASRPTSCGLPAPVVDITIRDPSTGIILPPKTPGEICVKGPNVALGYWENEQATKEAFSEDGWFRSGDIGYLDEEGFLYISDRAKDIIIRGGENISAGLIENVLYKDDRIKDVAVVPVPDAKLGELVAAIVVLHPPHRNKVTETDLQKVVATSLAKHCVPVMVEFREEMLRNATGKTEKNKLRVELAEIWEERLRKLKHGSGKAKL